MIATVSEERLSNNSVVTTAVLTGVTLASGGQYTLVVKNADQGTAITFYVNVKLDINGFNPGNIHSKKKFGHGETVLLNNQRLEPPVVNPTRNDQDVDDGHRTISVHSNLDSSTESTPPVSRLAGIVGLVLGCLLVILMAVVGWKVSKNTCDKQPEYTKLINLELGPTKRTKPYATF